jgi:ribosomal protein L24E
VKGIQVCSNKGPCPLQRGDNPKNVKMEWGHLKILFLKTMNPKKLNFTRKLSDMEKRQVD